MSKCAWVRVACVLTIQAKVFGEGLSNQELKAFWDKETYGPSIFLQAPRGKALVSWIKERKQLPPLWKEEDENAEFNITLCEAQTINGILWREKRFTLMTSAMAFHSSWVGSVPVGLCAQACRMKMECSGAFCWRRTRRIIKILKPGSQIKSLFFFLLIHLIVGCCNQLVTVWSPFVKFNWGREKHTLM